jgi:hypothetical protein
MLTFKIHEDVNGDVEVWFDQPVSEDVLEKIRKESEKLSKKDRDVYHLREIVNKVLKEVYNISQTDVKEKGT